MATYIAAFDAGGHESDQTCLSVAGFISTTELWTEFSAEWTKRLRGLPFYHHTEHRTKRDILPGLLEIIPVYAFSKFGAAVALKTFATLPNPSKKNAPNARLNAYALCANLCVGMAYQ